MDKIKIFVACHKPYDVYKDDVYTPIHVGRAVSNLKEEMKDMIGDDTGDNISEKNPFYSELTAQYWAWKNVHDLDYIGFGHYRRTFEKHFTNENIDSFFADGTDVILAGPMYRRWRYEFLKTFVCGEDLAIMLYSIKKLYPEYLDTISKYADGYIDYPLNMLICKKKLFDEYAKWIFNILFECEKYIKPSPYSRARRVYGYLSEFLMPTFFIHNKCKITSMRYVTDGFSPQGGISRKFLLKKKLSDKFLGINENSRLYFDYSIKAGLEADNILDFSDI